MILPIKFFYEKTFITGNLKFRKHYKPEKITS